MSSQGLEVIDYTTHQTHEWINELAANLGWADRRQVLMLLRSTLAALRDLLTPNEAAQFSAQLPLFIRGFFFEGWRPSVPLERTREAFVERVGTHLEKDLEYRGVEDIVAVLRLLNSRISEGEVRDMRQSLPKDIRSLWPE